MIEAIEQLANIKYHRKYFDRSYGVEILIQLEKRLEREPFITKSWILEKISDLRKGALATP